MNGKKNVLLLPFMASFYGICRQERGCSTVCFSIVVVSNLPHPILSTSVVFVCGSNKGVRPHAAFSG